ncbi:MAG: hypothetical protein CM1200mP30_00770 [Pseudomonadota bacterium]|nr:MAG: hypothetical protein CM1200mP30_00770 [Pseudomonadota bacterium]
MDPDERLPKEILKAADEISIRTLGFLKSRGIELNAETENRVLQSSQRKLPVEIQDLLISLYRTGKFQSA